MSAALKVWQKKLDFLQQQQAIASDAAQKFSLEEQINEAKARIAELKATSARSADARDILKFDISRIVKYAPVELIGREEETKLLNDAWAKVQNQESKRPHVLTFVALGGEGKTSLVAKWAADLAHRGWPGCDAAFAWSFYSQGTREQLAASSDLFLKEALIFFGADADKEFAASPSGAFEKGQRLARLVGQRRNLLILDGLEPLQYAPTSPTAGELKDQGLASLLRGLATTSAGLCVVTTRYSIPDLKAFFQTTAPQIRLLSLSREAGVHLLKTLGVKGSILRNIPFNEDRENINEFEKLVEDVKGHALTLNLLGTYLRDAHGGDLRKRDLVKLEEADAEEQGGHAFRVMEAYEREFEREEEKGKRALAVLRLLGLFDRPMSAEALAALSEEPKIPNLTEALVGLGEAQLNVVITRLQAANLLTVNRDSATALISIDAHPLLRDYFARQLRRHQPDAWRAAHRRLYEHLCKTESDQKPNPTLEDLQPLYQAVAHGCQAGLQLDAFYRVFILRIQRGTGFDGFHSTNKLGAFGSDLAGVAAFFEQPWSRISSALGEKEQSWLLNQAAVRLRALGRLTESLEPMRVSGEMDVKVKEWGGAAISYGNVSELDLTLGEVAGAVADAEQSVIYADRSGESFQRMGKRTTHADALHQAGRRAEAEARFREAEQMQAEYQPDYPLLYSMGGFRYSDLLLAAPERAAWQEVQGAEVRGQKSELVEVCRVVAERAAQTLEWGEAAQDWLLTIALDHLTLGRAALYEVVLAADGLSVKTQNSELKTSIDGAVGGLRRAGTTHHIPRSLLTRAWLRFLEGAQKGPESAQADLDEAWEIAERGPMRLFMADIHLYRARLFGPISGKAKDEGGVEYPWDKNPDGSPRGPKDDLAAARKLIEQCGYWRRKEELEDAEEAAKNW